MEASMFGVLAYVSPDEIPPGWPVPPAYYDRETGRRSLHHGLEQAEFADRLGFDWISFSEHHYSTMSVAPHPALTAAAVANRVRRARIAMLGHVLPLNSPVRVAEELAILDNLCDGRLVVGFLRGTPNEYQAYGVNPAETRERMIEGMELILKAWTEPQPFGWEGRYYRYRTVSVWPRPLQEPFPRTYMLGTSRESAEFAAAHRLGLGFSLDHFRLFTENYHHYLAKCAEAGWQPGPTDVLYRGSIYVAESDERAMEEGMPYWRGGRIAQHIFMKKAASAAVARVDPSPRDPGAGYGSPERRPPLNFVGSPETILRQLCQCREECGAGVVDLMFQGAGMPHDKVMRSLELFGTQVLPHIREI